jgi:oligogalacturonide lyase
MNRPIPSGVMNIYSSFTVLLVAAWSLMPATARAQAIEDDPTTIPVEWIDGATGRRVVRLSRGQGEYHSFYFHNNPFFKNDAEPPDDMMVYSEATSPGRGLHTINLRTRKIERIGDGMRTEIVGRGKKLAYFQRDGAVWALQLLSGEIRKIADLPEGRRIGFRTVNADETQLAGVEMLGSAGERPPGETKAAMMQRVFDAKVMRRLVVLDLESGKLRTILEEPNWFNHLQYSPTDPNMLMYCHEGPWHLLDRIWTIRTDGSAAEGRLMLRRTVHREIAGHEFWDPSGKTIWADQQIPRGETFFLTSIDLETAETKKYELERNEWSVHFNVSPDGTFFMGDGGSPGMVARAPDGQWMYRFEPGDGRLVAEKLANMADHDYALEPNGQITPDQKWLVFRSNMHGPAHVYAVEIEKAAQ